MKAGRFIVTIAVITLGIISVNLYRFFGGSLFSSTINTTKYQLDFFQAPDTIISRNILHTLTFYEQGTFNFKVTNGDTLDFTATYGINDSTFYLDSIPKELISHQLQLHIKNEDGFPTAYLYQIDSTGKPIINTDTYRSRQAPPYLSIFGVGKPMPRRYKTDKPL